MLGLSIASVSEERGQEEVAAEPRQALLHTDNRVLLIHYIEEPDIIYLGSQKRIQVLHMV